MNWITDDIAIGNYVDAEDVELLRKEGIRSILGLTRTLEGRQVTELGVAEIEIVPLDDGPGNDPRLFRGAVAALARLVKQAKPVLVHCHAGRSRSAVVVAAHLITARGIEAGQALALIASKREIAVTAGLEQLLDDYH